MIRLVVEVDDATAQRLTKRAAREGIMPSALAQRLLSEASELDPFEFVGSFASDSVAGRDADDSRSRWIRFRQSALTSSFLSFVV